MKAVKRKGQPDKHGWIKTSERMPEMSKHNVLGWYAKDEFRLLPITHVLGYPELYTYWQPLPKPPVELTKKGKR